jgi:NAD(P)-dependent dehydrogenase (short-subunit alcohol dehydrogenase family)
VPRIREIAESILRESDLVDLPAEAEAARDPELRRVIRADKLHQNVDYTPYEGMVVDGWPVLVMSRGDVIVEDMQLHATPGRGAFLRCDVSQEADAQAVVERACSLGKLVGLVNCAGVGPAEKTVGKTGPHSLAMFSRVVQINLIGTFNMLRLAADAMSRNAPEPSGERGVVVLLAPLGADWAAAAPLSAVLSAQHGAARLSEMDIDASVVLGVALDGAAAGGDANSDGAGSSTATADAAAAAGAASAAASARDAASAFALLEADLALAGEVAGERRSSGRVRGDSTP